MACGMIEVAATSSSSQWATQREILKKFEDRKFLIPKSISMDSNLNLEGIERPEFSADSLSLKSGAATNKSNSSRSIRNSFIN